MEFGLSSGDFPPAIACLPQTCFVRVTYLLGYVYQAHIRICLPIGVAVRPKTRYNDGNSTLSQAGFFSRGDVPLQPPWEPSPRSRHKAEPLRVHIIPGIQRWHIGDSVQKALDDSSIILEVSLCMNT